MFNACRRGPASISRVCRIYPSTIRIPSTRPSTLALSFQNTTKPIIEARWLHVSQQLQAGWGRDSGNESRGFGQGGGGRGGRGFGRDDRSGGRGGGGRGGGWGRSDSGEAADAEEFQPSRQNPNFPVVSKFTELIEHKLVHPNVVEAITKDMGHETMTEVQTMTINQALQGTDLYA